MKFRAGNLGFLASVDFLFLGLWMVVFIVAMILQAIPFFFIVMVSALAIGFPAGATLTVIPIAFLAMVYLCCMIASKITKRRAAATPAEGPRPGVRAGPRIALPNNAATPVDPYRDMRRLG